MSTAISSIVRKNEENILTLIDKYIRKNRYRFIYLHHRTISTTQNLNFETTNNYYNRNLGLDNTANYYYRHHFKAISIYLRENYTYMNILWDL
jgi:hypothetical protein